MLDICFLGSQCGDGESRHLKPPSRASCPISSQSALLSVGLRWVWDVCLSTGLDQVCLFVPSTEHACVRVLVCKKSTYKLLICTSVSPALIWLMLPCVRGMARRTKVISKQELEGGVENPPHLALIDLHSEYGGVREQTAKVITCFIGFKDRKDAIRPAGRIDLEQDCTILLAPLQLSPN